MGESVIQWVSVNEWGSKSFLSLKNKQTIVSSTIILVYQQKNNTNIVLIDAKAKPFATSVDAVYF